jgi:hypothetical protein
MVLLSNGVSIVFVSIVSGSISINEFFCEGSLSLFNGNIYLLSNPLSLNFISLLFDEAKEAKTQLDLAMDKYPIS